MHGTVPYSIFRTTNQSEALPPTYTHDLEQMHPKAHARDDRGSMLSNDRPQSSPGGGSTDGL